MGYTEKDLRRAFDAGVMAEGARRIIAGGGSPSPSVALTFEDWLKFRPK